MFGMFQKKGIGFKQIQRKKWLDRTLQVAIIGSLFTAFGFVIKRLIGIVAKLTGKSEALVTALLAATTIAISAVRQKIPKSQTKSATAKSS
jgi:hypothetical protein